MVDELAELLSSYPGGANRTRCFAHILNLAAKSIIRQFDVPKAQADAALDEAERELQELESRLNLEEDVMAMDGDGDDDEVDDNVDGWIDERTLMSVVDRAALDESVRPVRLVLVKVCFMLLK